MAFKSNTNSIPIARRFLEICVESVGGARAALSGGADQLELCSALALGGLTPSAGLVAAVGEVSRRAGIPVRAMVRPRAGDFSYDDGMLATAIDESRHLLGENVDGLVFGAVRDGGLCIRSLRRWRDAVRAMPGGETVGLTLHRAIDLVADPVAAIGEVIALGFDQVLTSGGARTALEGAATLAVMRAAAGDRLRIVAASGVNPATLTPLLDATGLGAVHSSARSGSAVPENPRFGFGDTPPQTDPEVVRRLRTLLDEIEDC